MFEKWQNLDGDSVDFVIYYAVGHDAAAWKSDSDCWKKKKSLTMLLVYFEFAVMKTGSEVLSIKDGWKPEMYFFITVVWSGSPI